MATCEMCGSVVNSTITIKIAGTNMQACNNCKHMGQPANTKQDLSYTHTFKKRKKENTSQEVITNYASVINRTLAQKGLNTHQLAKSLNIKESTINQYLSGKIQPDVLTAKKIARFLEITLTEDVEETNPTDYITTKSVENSNETLSLGDMLLKQMKEKK